MQRSNNNEAPFVTGKSLQSNRLGIFFRRVHFEQLSGDSHIGLRADRGHVIENDWLSKAGRFGQSDVSPWASLAIASAAFGALSLLTLHLLRRGYKLRH